MASALALLKLNASLVLIRKKGKLAVCTLVEDTTANTARLVELHKDASTGGQVVLVDDCLHRVAPCMAPSG